MLKALVSILSSGSQLEMRGETYVIFSTVSVTRTNTFNILKCPNTISQDWWVLIHWPYTENWAKSAWGVVALSYDTTVYINISNCSLTETNFSSIALSTFSTTPSVVTLGCLCVVIAGCKEWYDTENQNWNWDVNFHIWCKLMYAETQPQHVLSICRKYYLQHYSYLPLIKENVHLGIQALDLFSHLKQQCPHACSTCIILQWTHV